ncbi:MAG: protein-S-isoprenylcysteine methyltransferase, partial [Chakrabartia godavariana]
MEAQSRPVRPPRPTSAVSAGVGLAGLAGLFAWVSVACMFGMDGSWSALANLFACGLPMVLWSLFVDKVHLRPSTGLDWSRARPMRDIVDISLVKIAGLWATWGAIGVVYCLGRWYWRGNYLFAMELFEAMVPFLLLLSIPYVLWIDRHLVEPRDGAWHFGTWLIGQDGWEGEEIRHHLRAWAVKGFFLAFMFSIVPGGFGDVVRWARTDLLSDPVALASWLISFMFVIDVAFATVGYLLTMKPLDAHIRTANPHMQGWVAALICYPPF